MRRLHPSRPPPLPLHQGAQDREPVRRHRAELQRLLLRPGRPARHDEPHGQVRRRLRPRRAHRAWAQRRARRLHSDRGMAPRPERQNKKNEGFAIGHALNTAIGEGAVARHGAADGAALRRHRQRRKAVAAPDRRAGRIARSGRRIEEFPPRVRREVSVSPESLAFLRQRALRRGLTIPRARPTRRARSTSRSRARPARRRCSRAATGRRRAAAALRARGPRLVRRLRARGQAAHRLRGPGRARRPRRLGRGAGGGRDRRELLRHRGAARERNPPRSTAASAA